MKTKTQFEQLMESPEFRKLYAMEGLVIEAGEFIARRMQEQNVTKAELARRLGKSRAYVTQMLSGTTNLTLRTLAEVAYALGAEVKLEAAPLQLAQRNHRSVASQDPVSKVIETPRHWAGLAREIRLPKPPPDFGQGITSPYPYVA